MITPPCTLPSRFASSWDIVRANVISLALGGFGSRSASLMWAIQPLEGERPP
jgi:hypothetical protein